MEFKTNEECAKILGPELADKFDFKTASSGLPNQKLMVFSGVTTSDLKDIVEKHGLIYFSELQEDGSQRYSIDEEKCKVGEEVASYDAENEELELYSW